MRSMWKARAAVHEYIQRGDNAMLDCSEGTDTKFEYTVRCSPLDLRQDAVCTDPNTKMFGDAHWERRHNAGEKHLHFLTTTIRWLGSM
jgi:hypothetical protein